VSRELTGQKLLSEMATYLGILRSNVYMALQLHELSTAPSKGSRPIYDIYAASKRELVIRSSDSSIRAYLQLQPQLPIASDPRNTLIRFSWVPASTVVIRPDRWWDISAAGVDELRALQRETLRLSQEGVQGLYDQEREKRDRTLAVPACSASCWPPLSYRR
jgi:hypothetical protein